MPFLKIETRNSPVSLYFEDYGQGQPVVLIHGWPLSHRMWEGQVNALTEAGYRCVAYDRRGFGDSDKPWDGYDYDALASDLDALLTTLDLRDVVLAGFSMGGGEVARYLGRYGSGRVSKAMLIAAVPPFLLKTADNPQGVGQEVFDGMLEGVKEDRITFLDGFVKNFFNWDEANKPISDDLLSYNKAIAWAASPRATQECIRAFGTTDFRADLQKITVPTLVIHGDADQIVPFEVSGERSAELISGSHLEVIKGAPHGLNVTHTEALNRLMLDFLRS